jgi:hypothetical protein
MAHLASLRVDQWAAVGLLAYRVAAVDRCQWVAVDLWAERLQVDLWRLQVDLWRLQVDPLAPVSVRVWG